MPDETGEALARQRWQRQASVADQQVVASFLLVSQPARPGFGEPLSLPLHDPILASKVDHRDDGSGRLARQDALQGCLGSRSLPLAFQVPAGGGQLRRDDLESGL
jgi:hypothetical protein